MARGIKLDLEQRVKIFAPIAGSAVKNLPSKAGDAGDEGSIHGSGRSPGGGNGNQLQYSYLENPMDRGACRATGHRVAQSDRTEAT